MYRMIFRELTNSRSNSIIPFKRNTERASKTDEEQSNGWIEHFPKPMAPTNQIDFEQEIPVILLDVTMDNISGRGGFIPAIPGDQQVGRTWRGDNIMYQARWWGGHRRARILFKPRDRQNTYNSIGDVKLPKKYNLSDCSNWWGVTLLSIPGNVFSPTNSITRTHGQWGGQMSAFQEDLEDMGVSWHGARMIANDRNKWRFLLARCSERNRRT